MAEELVGEMGIMDMDVSNNWCTRFIKQHDLSVGGQSAAARKPVAKWKPAQLAEGISPAAMANAARCKDATDTKARYEAQLRYEAAEALFKYEAAESRLRALAACRAVRHDSDSRAEARAQQRDVLLGRLLRARVTNLSNLSCL